MLRGLYTGWTGMVNEQKRLDVISNNLANADTLGYKQESVSSQSFDKLLTIKIRDGSQAYHNQAIGTMSLGVKVGEVYTDYSQGSIRGTSSPLDLALSGSGFFTITTTNAKGETVTRYTRDGSFQMTKDGYLVDSQGNRVQGSGGDIQIDPNAKDITIDNSGRITVDGEVKDTLKIVDFEDYDYDFDDIEKFNVGKILPVFIFYKVDKEITRLCGEHKKEEFIKIIEGEL